LFSKYTGSSFSYQERERGERGERKGEREKGRERGRKRLPKNKCRTHMS